MTPAPPLHDAESAGIRMSAFNAEESEKETPAIRREQRERESHEMRSFPPPEPQEGRVGHHIVPLRATEFNVRVRTPDLKTEALHAVAFDVYSLKARSERPRLTAVSVRATGAGNSPRRTSRSNRDQPTPVPRA